MEGFNFNKKTNAVGKPCNELPIASHQEGEGEGRGRRVSY